MLRRMCDEDPEALTMLRKATTGTVGRPAKDEEKDDNIINKSGQGTAKDYTLDRLSRERPDLYEKVVGDGLKAYAERIGKERKPLTEWVNAAQVYKRVPRGTLLDASVRALYEISKAPESLWGPPCETGVLGVGRVRDEACISGYMCVLCVYPWGVPDCVRLQPLRPLSPLICPTRAYLLWTVRLCRAGVPTWT